MTFNDKKGRIYGESEKIALRKMEGSGFPR